MAHSLAGGYAPVSNILEGATCQPNNYPAAKDAEQEHSNGHSASAVSATHISTLDWKLEATRTEVRAAGRDFENSSDEPGRIQTTNQELATSKEELHSQNEEFTALNSPHKTLARQRMTSSDLQNILYSMEVATLFLDANLNIRFFTPSAKQFFNVIPSDVGRPLTDLNSLTGDAALHEDARTVLRRIAPVEREIQAPGGAWYTRRILPYRAQDDRIEGVVITFFDITKQKLAADILENAKRQAQAANIGKSRLLAAANHDLRQPLQTLTLLQGLLGKIVKGEKAQYLVARLNQTLATIPDILNTLLDINQIEDGPERVEISSFPIYDLLEGLRAEFTYRAQAKGLSLRVVPSRIWVESDPRLLEQMIRNLLSNALKYTKHGKILVGCRRRAGRLSIEVWDTGIGIPEKDLQVIFEEYHQLDDAARERSRGLGLGLSIVQQLGILLKHRVHVRSYPAKGSVFAIDILLPPSGVSPHLAHPSQVIGGSIVEDPRRKGMILVVEDDAEVCEFVELFLKDEGHFTATARDGLAALELVARAAFRPDIILCDYNLPNGIDGLQLSLKLREKLHHEIPVIILTGDISSAALRKIALHDCLQLNKPVKPTQLREVIQGLLPPPPPMRNERQTKPPAAAGRLAHEVIFVVDDDTHIREAMRDLLQQDGRIVEAYDSAEAFLDAYRPGRDACLLIDAHLPGMSGLELLKRLYDNGDRMPAIMITGNSDVAMAVLAMKAGASDFIEKPVGGRELLASIARAFEQSRDSSKVLAAQQRAAKHVALLTPREQEIMALVLAGHSSKNIAADLDLSQRTVEAHRASIMKKTGAKSLPALARLGLAAAKTNIDDALT